MWAYFILNSDSYLIDYLAQQVFSTDSRRSVASDIIIRVDYLKQRNETKSNFWLTADITCYFWVVFFSHFSLNAQSKLWFGGHRVPALGAILLVDSNRNLIHR